MLKLWQRLDVIGGVAQGSRWRSDWKGNGLVEWTVPTHDLSQPQGELTIGTGVAIDKVSKRFRNIVTIDIAEALDFEGDIFRDVTRPMLKRVEGDDPDRVVELSRHQIGDDRFEVRPLDVGFAVSGPKAAKAVDHEVDGLIRAIGAPVPSRNE